MTVLESFSMPAQPLDFLVSSDLIPLFYNSPANWYDYRFGVRNGAALSRTML